MRLSFDRAVNAAYIYLVAIGHSEVEKTESVTPAHNRGTYNLTLNKNGRLIGIEILKCYSGAVHEVLGAGGVALGFETTSNEPGAPPVAAPLVCVLCQTMSARVRTLAPALTSRNLNSPSAASTST